MAWREDLVANTGLSGVKGAIVGWITSPGFVMITWWRFAKRLRSSGRIGRALSWIVLRSCLTGRGCYISLLAEIGPGLILPHPIGLVIGEGVRIGRSVTLYQSVTLGRHGLNKAEYPQLADNVVVYAGAVVIGPVTIGEAAVIAANSVVNRDVPPESVAAGIPARILSGRKATPSSARLEA